MTTYHTGNPVGSTNPKDLYDNAQNLDDLMLGQLRQYLDRLGVPRLSWAGIEAAFQEDQVQRSLDFDEAQTNRENVFNQFLIGTQFEMPPIPYQEGGPIEVSRPTQLISHEGQLYSVKLPASFPFQLSGIWDVAVVSLTPREDASLRQQLSSAIGSSLSGHTRLPVITSTTSVMDYLSLMPLHIREFSKHLPPGQGDNPDTWDWTVAIDMANAQPRPVFYGPGTYNYNGAGSKPGSNWTFRGAGIGQTIINLAPGSFFIDTGALCDSITLTGFSFKGGKGCLQSRGTGTLVGRQKHIENCEFDAYTGCCISNNAFDNPYWKIKNNTFKGANTLTTMAIALAGNSDCSDIDDNSFLNDKVHIKCRDSGRVGMKGNDLIQFSMLNGQRVAIWLTAPNNNRRQVLTAWDNKFGNENLSPTDYRVVILPELEGEFNGDRLPDFSAITCPGNYQLDLRGGMVNGSGGAGRPLVYTASQPLRNSVVGGIKLLGTRPSYLVEYADPSTGNDSYVSGVVFEPCFSEASAAEVPVALTNRTNNVYTLDPAHMSEGIPSLPNSTQALSVRRVGFKRLATTEANNFAVTSPTEKVGNLPGSDGMGKAAEYRFTAINGDVRAALSAQPDKNTNCYLEFEMAKGSSGSAQSVRIQLFSGTNTAFARGIILPDDWGFFRFPFSISGPGNILVRIVPDQPGTFKFGNFDIYQARSPVSLRVATFDQLNLANLPTSAAGLPQGAAYRAGGFVRYVE